ncbi:NAD(P)-binding protein [Xylariaceae sp. FL0804]|nr:NAD(P)-binding protein [Xylariaceae sp. FL0804]
MAARLPSKILIVGASGTIGKHITNAIVSAEPRVAQQVSILTSPDTVQTQDPHKRALVDSWMSRGLDVILGDVGSAADVARAYDGVDTVVSCLGRGALAAQEELVRLAEASGTVKWFFPSEYGTDIEYDASSRDEKPHQNKLALRRYIRENVKRLSCTYLVTGPYIDMFLTSKRDARHLVGGFDEVSKRATVIGSGDDPVGFTSMPDVGKLLAAALRHPEASMGKVLKVQSFVTTPNAIVKEYEKQMGAAWEVEHIPNQKLRDTERELWKDGDELATTATLRRIWSEGGTLYEKTDNEKLGLRPEDMESLGAVVKRAIDGVGY